MPPKVGEKVTIRLWDDMAEEFGEEYGDIPTPAYFVHHMRDLCGEVLTVAGYLSCGEFFQCVETGYEWNFDTKMTEEYKHEEV